MCKQRYYSAAVYESCRTNTGYSSRKKLSLIIVYRTLCKTDTTQLIMRRNQTCRIK